MDYDATVTNKWRMLVIGAALSPLKFSKNKATFSNFQQSWFKFPPPFAYLQWKEHQMLVLKCLTMLIKSENSSGKKGLHCTEQNKIQLDCNQKLHMFVFGVALSAAIIVLSKSILQTHTQGSALWTCAQWHASPGGGYWALYVLPEKGTKVAEALSPAFAYL